jgi:tripartite-type tricarboxylate transporter receptor subunit TctC
LKLVSAAFAVALALASAAAVAQYPSKPIHLVVPFPAGAIADGVTRIIGQALSKNLAQPVIVDNRAGADGAIGTLAVIKSQPDGYSLLIGAPAAIFGPQALHRNPPFDLLTDLTPVTLIGRSNFLLYVHPSVPARTLAELIAYARAHPDVLSYGSGNTIAILATFQLARAADIRMVHVPYKGDAPVIVDLLAGRVQVLFSSTVNALAHAKEGRLRALAALQRSSLAPEIPTMAEAGMPISLIDVIWGIYGPAKMPREIVARLSRESNLVLQDPEVRAQLARQGFEAEGSTPERLATLVKEQLAVWTRIARESGATLD